MSLTLHFHPLASFCQKVLVGLYELDIPFTKNLVDLGNETERAALLKLWPIGKFPVLRDEARGLTLAESSIILEYIAEQSAKPLLPPAPDAARECRFRDRFFDLYVDGPMQKIVTDKLRPEGLHDPYGVEQAKAQLETAYGVADTWFARDSLWAVGDSFSLADCAAAPALFYADKVLPFRDRHPELGRYFARLLERPSFARVLAEAQPYFALFPG